MTGLRLIPDRAHYLPGTPVLIELDGDVEDGELVVTRLHEVIRRVTVSAGASSVEVGELPIGGYGVAFGDARSAVDVLASAFDRPRYGFVSRLADDADPHAVARVFRRLHLNMALLYDWAYRHSQLLPAEDRYLDPLGQERSLAMVNAMAETLDSAGTLPLGYSAVYAIGHDEVDEWRDSILLRTDGEPYRLGEAFLVLVDPVDPRWLAHYLAQLEGALEGTSLRGFHLDQFGWPKFARRVDGARVDLSAAFVELLERVRSRLPDAAFMFNNVNDFPTAATARTPQDASYIEVWPPHSDWQDLADLASRTRALRPEHPPILSAYLSCFDDGETAAVHAAEIIMATAFSHGADHLLLGEDGAALTDAYYPKHHRLSPEALEAFVPWYDFAVRYGDLLYDPAQSDVTESFTGGINGDVVVEAPGVVTSTKAAPGTLWTRVVRTSEGLVIHLVDLTSQTDPTWDAGKPSSTELRDVTVSLAPVGDDAVLRFATVDAPDMIELAPVGSGLSEQTDALSAAQSRTTFAVPPFRLWATVLVPVEAYG